MPFHPFDPSLVLDAAFTAAEAGRVLEAAAGCREEDLWRPDVQADARARLVAAVPRLDGLRAALEACLLREPHSCVLRGGGFLAAAEADRVRYVAVLSLLLGDLSEGNVRDAASGRVAEAVRPIDPAGRDVTYTLGACEAHADESSKPAPEDVACLWCVRPARRGGATVVWPVPQLIRAIASRGDGADLLRVLRTRRFPFGGKLRQPPRVLLAPILFGDGGIRFRLGTIRDGFDALGTGPDAEQAAALAALVEAVRATSPWGWRLEPGEALLVLNRRVLHAREDFDDPGRWLIRTRLYDRDLSNTDADRDVAWHAAAPACPAS